MRRMTCGNGFIFVAAICTGLMVTSARGGSLDALAAPESTNSAMWTLNDIYNVLDTRTTNVAKRAGAFSGPPGGPTNGTMRTLNDIMTLVTNRSPVPKTGLTKSYVPNDNGWYSTNVGVAWPTQRFTALATNTPGQPDAYTNQIRDNLTGLIWARNVNLTSNAAWAALGRAQINGSCTWLQAFDAITNTIIPGPVNGANYGGANDWRLPNIKEIHSLIDASKNSPALPSGHPFVLLPTANGNTYWWSSTTIDGYTTKAIAMFLYDGDIEPSVKATANNYVWPVRGGQ